MTRAERTFAVAPVAYVLIGAAWALWPIRDSDLRVTTLSVGHGLCTVIQTPANEVYVYDVGSLAHPERTARRIVDALLALRISRIDSLILSHADQDHFGAVEGVIDAIPVDQVRCHQTLLDSQAWSVRRAFDAIAEQNIAIKQTAAGDHWDSGGVQFEVLHPSSDADFQDDNANSLVLMITFSDRRILLTGDVEGDGLAALLSQPRGPIDVMLAPHHGGRAANRSELNEWARPKAVLSSSGRPNTEFLQSIYPAAICLETEHDGAITVRVSDRGTTRISTFREPKRRAID